MQQQQQVIRGVSVNRGSSSGLGDGAESTIIIEPVVIQPGMSTIAQQQQGSLTATGSSGSLDGLLVPAADNGGIMLTRPGDLHFGGGGGGGGGEGLELPPSLLSRGAVGSGAPFLPSGSHYPHGLFGGPIAQTSLAQAIPKIQRMAVQTGINKEDVAQLVPVIEQAVKENMTVTVPLAKGGEIKIYGTGDCPVCLEKITTAVVPPCGHIICDLCFGKLKNKRSCSFCRNLIDRVIISPVNSTNFVESDVYREILTLLRYAYRESIGISGSDGGGGGGGKGQQQAKAQQRAITQPQAKQHGQSQAKRQQAQQLLQQTQVMAFGQILCKVQYGTKVINSSVQPTLIAFQLIELEQNKNFAFVIDVSGSMIDSIRDLRLQLIAFLQSQLGARVSISLFNTHVTYLLRPTLITPQSLPEVITAIQTIRADGGTALGAALLDLQASVLPDWNAISQPPNVVPRPTRQQVVQAPAQAAAQRTAAEQAQVRQQIHEKAGAQGGVAAIVNPLIIIITDGQTNDLAVSTSQFNALKDSNDILLLGFGRNYNYDTCRAIISNDATKFEHVANSREFPAIFSSRLRVTIPIKLDAEPGNYIYDRSFKEQQHTIYIPYGETYYVSCNRGLPKISLDGVPIVPVPSAVLERRAPGKLLEALIVKFLAESSNQGINHYNCVKVKIQLTLAEQCVLKAYKYNLFKKTTTDSLISTIQKLKDTCSVYEEAGRYRQVDVMYGGLSAGSSIEVGRALSTMMRGSSSGR